MNAVSPRAVITGIGAVTAVGLTALQTAASVRAGISRFTELEEIDDDIGEPVVAALVPWPSEEDQQEGQDRQAMLLQRAVVEALNSAGLGLQPSRNRVALLLALPEEGRPDSRQSNKGSPRWNALETPLAGRVSVVQKEVVAAGHAGVLLALAKAIDLLERNVCDAVVIGATDSLVDVPALEWLDTQRRLKTTYAPKGFVPGEASAALVVEKAAPPLRKGARVWAGCHEVVMAMEPVGLDSEEPPLATGLTQALHGALDRAQVAPCEIEDVLCDLNGEPYRANEWCLARNRALGRAGDLTIWHPADALGDVGSATSAVLCVLACVGFARRYWTSSQVLLWSASDAGHRAAVCLTSGDGLVPGRS